MKCSGLTETPVKRVTGPEVASERHRAPGWATARQDGTAASAAERCGRDVAIGLRPIRDAQIVSYRKCQHERREPGDSSPTPPGAPWRPATSSPVEPAGHRGPRTVHDGRHGRRTRNARAELRLARRRTAQRSPNGDPSLAVGPRSRFRLRARRHRPPRGRRRRGGRNAGPRSRRSDRRRLLTPVPNTSRLDLPATAGARGLGRQPEAA